MEKIKIDDLPKCPVETTLMFLNDRNSFLTLGYIIQGITDTESLLKTTGLSDESLKITVNALERKGLISVEKDNFFPTTFGKSFKVIINAMAHWGEQYKAGYDHSQNS